MPGPAHPFASRWLVPGDTAEVFELLADAARLPEWWGSVHASARVLDDGRPDGSGRTVELVSGARVPVLLRTRATLAAINRPYACAWALEGDVTGELSWHLRRDGPYVIADLACRARGSGDALQRRWGALPGLARMEFAWAMRQGRLGLLLELRRRHAVSAHERAMIPHLEGVAVRLAQRDSPPAGALLRPVRTEPGEPVR